MRARLIFCLILPFALQAAGVAAEKQNPPAQEKQKGKAAPAKPAAAQSMPGPLVADPPAKWDEDPRIPADAVRLDQNLWRWTDPQGKEWRLQRSPFGVTKFDPAAVPPEKFEYPVGMKAVEAGDEVKFERPTPFGVARWTKKKSELNDVEQAVWERDRPKPPAAENAPEPAKPSGEKQ
jgi:hypothetical protein